MAKLMMMRHGQSEWNGLNLFTGWVDVPLSKKGIREALEGGELIKDLLVDEIFTSKLVRAQMTAMLAMSVHSSGKVPVISHQGEGQLEKWTAIHSEETKSQCIPVFTHSALNERMYGELQGLNKSETIEKYGATQVKIWRRSYDTPPPGGESLEMTAARAIPYFTDVIVPSLEQGKNVFVFAHGNSLRSIIMFLDHLTKQQVLELELGTGVPIVYDFNPDSKLFIKESI